MCKPKKWLSYRPHPSKVVTLLAAFVFICSIQTSALAAAKGSRPRKSTKTKTIPRPVVPSLNCGAEVVYAFVIQVQNFDRTSASEGERIATKCPADESYEALQWTSFLFAIEGERDRSRIVDRLWIKPPGKNRKSVERTLQLARLGSPQLLREKLANFDPAYSGDVKNRWTLGRALARAGDIDSARKEYFTYLAARPADETAEIEYLYLNVWAGDGPLALKQFRDAMQTHTSKTFLAAMERGINLVYKLWPSLMPVPIASAYPIQSPAMGSPTPSPSPSPLPLPLPSSSSAPGTLIPQQTEKNQDAMTSHDAKESGGVNSKEVMVAFTRDQVTNYFDMTHISVRTDGVAVDPEIYLLRTRYTALSEPSSDSGGVRGHRLWQLHETLQAGAGVGWFSSPAGGFATGRIYFLANVPMELQIGAGMSRRALAEDVPLIKQDLRVTRDAMESSVSWKRVVSWHGALEWEGNGIPHERYDGTLRWAFSGDCSVERCLDFFVPILWERYQTLSPYYYSDNERIGYAVGVMTRIDIDKNKEYYTRMYGKVTSWQAMLPNSDIEYYSASELSFELGWLRRNDQLSMAYDWRRTSSEKNIRKYEVPTSIRVTAGMGL